MANPTKVHETMANHVLCYLKGTMDQKLIFQKSKEEICLFRCCDADWANSLDRKSITGYAFQLVSSGAVISWKSRKRRAIALSTCKAEYMALAEATQEAMFLIQLLKDMISHYSCDNLHYIVIIRVQFHLLDMLWSQEIKKLT